MMSQIQSCFTCLLPEIIVLISPIPPVEPFASSDLAELIVDIESNHGG
jgi:hypothetical protein